MNQTHATPAAPGHNSGTAADLEAAYRARTPGSARLAGEARRHLPSGVVHDSRYFAPYAPYVDHAEGSRKWDVDGNCYIDYFGGHGSLLLGHNHPKVLAAMQAALARGTHFAANHEPEVKWAERVCAMVPSAERVRFTSSGTEAAAMAVRLARAHTGRNRILRFFNHFHGWIDDMTTGYASHFDGSAPNGVPEAVARGSVVIEANDPDALSGAFAGDHDIAAIFVESLGAATGQVPLAPGFHALLRETADRHGAVLIFDEVITGFRVSPGGVQARVSVTPDLTTLAKILAGGLPGGAVAGRSDIMGILDFEESRSVGREKMYHPGTFNGNPLSASAGVAALDIIRDGAPCEKAEALAGELRHRLNDELAAAGVPWAVYGQSSAFHFFMGSGLDGAPHDFDPLSLPRRQLLQKDAAVVHDLRLALLVEGVDFSGWPGGLVSAAHTPEDIEMTVEAFARALKSLG